MGNLLCSTSPSGNSGVGIAHPITSTELFNKQSDIRLSLVIVDLRNVSQVEFEGSHIDMAHHCPLLLSWSPFQRYREQQKLKEILLENVKYKQTEVVFYQEDDKAQPPHWATTLTGAEGSSITGWWLLQGGLQEYRQTYPFMCSGHELYTTGRLFPSQITPNVFLSNWALATEPVSFHALGLTHVVNCTPDHPHVFENGLLPPDQVPDLTGGQQVPPTGLPKIQYHRVPVVDSADVDLLEHMDAAVEFIQESVEAGGKVLVHCRHGQSRSATVLAGWLIKHRDMTDQAALQWLKSCRPRVSPNPGFLGQLDAFHCTPADVGQQEKGEKKETKQEQPPSCNSNGQGHAAFKQ